MTPNNPQRFAGRIWDKNLKVFLPYPCYVNHLNPNEFTAFNRYFQMDEEGCTFQQWTGLFDKKGVKIYEGDFVTTSEGLSFLSSVPQYACGQVKWLRYGFEVTQKSIGATPIHEFVFEGTACSEVNDGIETADLEVIGNIFETPAYLEA